MSWEKAGSSSEVKATGAQKHCLHQEVPDNPSALAPQEAAEPLPVSVSSGCRRHGRDAETLFPVTGTVPSDAHLKFSFSAPGNATGGWEENTLPSVLSYATYLFFSFIDWKRRLDSTYHKLPSQPGRCQRPRKALPALPGKHASHPPPRHTGKAPSTHRATNGGRAQPSDRRRAGPKALLLRGGQGNDTHCGEMSKRTSLSSHSTSSTALMAAGLGARRSLWRARAPPWQRGWCLALPQRSGLAAALHVLGGEGGVRSPAYLSPGSAEVAAAGGAGLCGRGGRARCAQRLPRSGCRALRPAGRLGGVVGHPRQRRRPGVCERLWRRAECCESLERVAVAAFPRALVLSGTR